MDVAAFLRSHAPFDGLDPEALHRAAATARERRSTAGTVILRQRGDPARSLYVILEGAVEVVADGRPVDVLGEGDVFGHLSLVTGEEPVATIRTTRDTVLLTFDRQIAIDLLGTPAGAEFIAGTSRRRFDELAASTRDEPIRTADMTVGSLVHRMPLVCDAMSSVAETARAMADAHASAAIFPAADDRLGIVTDVDLRARVLAEGLDPSTPVHEVATAPAATVTEDVLAAEALFQMVQGGFHHLPVVSVSGDLVGVVTETDVIGFGADSPFAIRSSIERSADRSAVVEAAQRLPDAVSTLVRSDVDAVHIGHIVGATIDVLTRKLLELAFEQHGSPPVAWAWLAFGSLGRREQALHTDQDHGLAYAGTKDDEPSLDPYFLAIAEFVTQGLEDAGLPRCEGNMMAVSDGLRRSVEGWVEQLRTWTDMHERHATEIATVVFDFRQVTGPLDMERVLGSAARAAATNVGFRRRLAEKVRSHEPPIGRVRDFIVESSGRRAGTLDLKHGGILPITDIARFHALTSGVSAHRTLDRLRMAAQVGQIDQKTRIGLAEAFTLLWQLRLEHQVACVAAGEDPDDFIRPDELLPVRRQGLKAAFGVIASAQRAVSSG